ncbi:MAG: nucleoside-diphosphate sugar epimerase/dehydratase [Dehalococcoidia bacterium]|jgi:FlaA1/EpsC-like NDP-sugar epimerase|nr:nucleoside-diphosphate sugar epimerase/dehydratase [Dehalococcoidia bacterium]
MSTRTRRFVLVLLHIVLVTASFWAAFWVRLDFDVDQISRDIFWESLPILLAVRLASLAGFRLFRGMWRYVAIPDLVQILKATIVSSIAFVALQWWLFGFDGFPRSVFLIDFVGNIILLSGTRLGVRILRERSMGGSYSDAGGGRLLIIGAGDAGASLCSQAFSTNAFQYTPVAFADDDRSKVGQTIIGVPVAGRISEIPSLVRRYKVDIAVIAIASVSASRKRAIVEMCREAGVECKILPATADLVDGSVSVSEIREVDIVDLLGRSQAVLDVDLIRESIRGKKVMVTGAAGSVGSELARQIAALEPSVLMLVDRAENQLVYFEAEIRPLISPRTDLVVRIVDVNDQPALLHLMKERYPDTVFHAAAHKHVNLMEDAPSQAISNNVGGTLSVARCAIEVGADNFLLISTDKAVNPTSVMGATKRFAELVIRELNRTSSTRLIAVRFGNVLGSNASVVPIFSRQIENGGPVTVTDPGVERYFMSGSEAVGLILQAAAVGKGGEVYILEMGDPIKIVTLAETLITLSGLTPGEDIEIVYTGLKPGEKMGEELSFSGEDVTDTGLDKLWVLNGAQNDAEDGMIEAAERLLRDLPELGEMAARNRIADVLPGYRPASASDRTESGAVDMTPARTRVGDFADG